MKYEFYFLRETGQNAPEVLRVIAASYQNAASIVARQYGCNLEPGWHGRETADLDIRPIEIQNIFERNSFPANLP
ncbi:MAG: hypothetical protein ACRD3L_02085 [Terriglobales bacterium]